ncbi:hypothetical protein FQR65_LT20661 [Abscondita terminalis]|nr:hypothetical protein FQR65_LT20661 [Abscondita terminalis]
MPCSALRSARTMGRQMGDRWPARGFASQVVRVSKSGAGNRVGACRYFSRWPAAELEDAPGHGLTRPLCLVSRAGGAQRIALGNGVTARAPARPDAAACAASSNLHQLELHSTRAHTLIRQGAQIQALVQRGVELGVCSPSSGGKGRDGQDRMLPALRVSAARARALGVVMVPGLLCGGGHAPQPRVEATEAAIGQAMGPARRRARRWLSGELYWSSVHQLLQSTAIAVAHIADGVVGSWRLSLAAPCQCLTPVRFQTTSGLALISRTGWPSSCTQPRPR